MVSENISLCSSSCKYMGAYDHRGVAILDPSRMIDRSYVIVRLSLLRKTILIPEYLAFMCVCVFVDGCISQF